MIINKKIKVSHAKSLIGNILNLNKYQFDDQTKNKILTSFAKYFIVNSNWFLQYKDQRFAKPTGMLAAAINTNQHISINQEALAKLKETDNEYLKQFIIFQERIMKAIEANASSEFKAELVAFSSLAKGKGIGSTLIKMFHEQLINQQINKYYLFTDDNCDFKWYLNHGYKLIGKYEIKIDDLNLIFDENIKKYHVYKFYKDLV